MGTFNTAIDKGKNFIVFYSPEGPTVKMIRWGWFEDNIISKYVSLVGAVGKPIVTFRSLAVELDEGGNPKYTDKDGAAIKTSVRIPDHNLLRPINPSHSLIFKSEYSTMKGSAKSRTQKIEHMLVEVNNTMVGGSKSRQFNHPEYTSTDSKEGDGYLRNIFVNVEVIQKKFGIDIDNLGPSQGTDGYHTEGISPSTNIVASMKSVLSEISANFSNFWDFDVITDVSNPENSLVVDKNHSPVRVGSYTRFLQSDLGNPAQVSDLGVYLFPSMEFSSVVKNQTFDVSIPKGDAAVYYYAANSVNTEPSSDIEIRSAQNFAAIQNSDRDLEAEQGLYGGLGRLYTQYPNGGYPYGDESRKIKLESDFNHKEKVHVFAEFYNEAFDGIAERRYWRKYSATPTAKSGKIETDESPTEDRSIIFSDGRYQYVTEKPKEDVANILEQAGSNVTDFVASGGGSFSVDELEAINESEGKATAGGLTFGEPKIKSMDELDFSLAFNEGRTAGDNEFFGSDSTSTADPNKTAVEVFIGPTQNNESVTVEEVFDSKPKPKKAVTVTAETQNIDFLYYSVDPDGSSDSHPLERMRLKSTVKKYASTLMNSSGTKGRKSMPPFYPASLSLTIDGISGIGPGNLFNVSYAPAKYNKNFVNEGTGYGPLMFFRISDLKQEVTVDGWNTSFSSIGIQNNDAMSEFTKLKQSAVDDFFSLEMGRAFGTENMPLDYLGKIKDFISVIGDVADSVTNFFDAALTNQAETKAAKKLAEAEREEKKKKIDNMDGKVTPVSEQDGEYLKKIAGVTSDITTPIQGVAGGVATIAIGGFGAISDSISNFLSSGFGKLPEGDISKNGNINPSGGEKSTTVLEADMVDVGGSDKSPDKIPQTVDEELGIPTSDIPASFGVRLANTVKKIKASLRRKQRDIKSPKPSERAIVLLKKIKFTHNVSTTAMAGDFNVQVETIGKFKEKEETFITAEMAGSSVFATRKRIKKYNEQVIAARFAVEFPDEEIAENEGSTQQNPGYPFTQENFGITDPFGSHENAAAARAALASIFMDSSGNRYNSYTAYKNDLGPNSLSIRKEHWDSNSEIW